MDNLSIFLVIWIVLLREAVCEDSFLSKFVQHDFKMRNIRFEINSYDKDYVNLLTLTTFKYNRTTAVTNATFNFKTTFGDQIQAIVQAYKFLSNEYRIFPGIRFQVNLCNALNSNMAGTRAAFNCGNFSHCFFAKDVTYHFCNFVVDETRLPPNIPNGEYKAAVEMVYLKAKVATLNVYAEIYRPIYPKNKKPN